MSRAVHAPVWRRWCREGRVRCEGDTATVCIGPTQRGSHARTQVVRVRVVEDGLLLESVVAQRRHVTTPEAIQCDLWLRNRARDLINVSIDRSGKVVASCWIPHVALERDEFLFALRHLASEADRLEFLMTGSGE